VIEIMTYHLGDDHIETAKTNVERARVLDAMRKYDQAEPLFRDALQAAKKLGEMNAEYYRIKEIYENRKAKQNSL
jgi:hypothetical protein